ncbi:MAG TPA: hypothetical protein VF535_02685 [Allosphingosinicella sp.]|jgi:ribulose 1,5-bisphosphate carboxylase large subunit-like protein
MSKVVVHAAYRLSEKAPEDFDALFLGFIDQVGRDLLVGTFSDFHQSIFPSEKAFSAFKDRAAAAAACHDDRKDEEVEKGLYGFRLDLDVSLFADPAYGLQRLVHMLVSDVYMRRFSKVVGGVIVRSIDFGDLRNDIEKVYRTRSHDRHAIRAAFKLPADRPLLAFSLKPRSCLSDEDYYAMVRSAFDGGCEIVELDTRDLQLSGDPRIGLLESLSQLAIDMSKGRVCRFSANLSGPQRVIRPIYERLAKVHEAAAADGPWVVKVDGNLDGLSTVQAIRADEFEAYRQPIITCYPVLKYALANALGPNGFVQMLAMSGVDIIYPGQSPAFGTANGRIDTNQVAAARKHYIEMDMGGYPMLSVAGGVAINSVHACMSVLGGDIAFFIGGGIATSKRGIRSGAQNFAQAIELSRVDLFEKGEIRNLERKMVDLSKIYFDDGEIPADYEFIEPRTLKAIGDRFRSTNLGD